MAATLGVFIRLDWLHAIKAVMGRNKDEFDWIKQFFELIEVKIRLLPQGVSRKRETNGIHWLWIKGSHQSKV